MTDPKQFYVAYLNILGCRCFFNQNPDKAKDLLDDIHAAFDTVTNIIECVQRAALETSDYSHEEIPKLKAYRKVFSNEVLMCFEKTGDAFFDLNNLLAMASIVADIQREFILKYGISLGGCISQGAFSIDEDFAFGRELVETTSFEDFTQIPRIVFTAQILQELSAIRPSLAMHELKWFYDSWLDELLFQDKNGQTILNYLYKVNGLMLERTPFFAQVTTMMESRFPKTHGSVSKYSYGIREVMDDHSNVIEGKLDAYGNYDDIDESQTQTAMKRLEVFRKYLWVADFHNSICERNGLGEEFKIDVSTEDDNRFGLPRRKNAYWCSSSTSRA